MGKLSRMRKRLCKAGAIAELEERLARAKELAQGRKERLEDLHARYETRRAKMKGLQRKCSELELELADARSATEYQKAIAEGVLAGPKVEGNQPPNAERLAIRAAYHDHYQKVWRHWMRLGVLHQYSPKVPLLPEFPEADASSVLPTMLVVTPSYNQADFLGATMDSVLAQDYPGLEYIVLDGGSDDGSADLIADRERELSYWVSEPDRGQADAVRRGFQHSDLGEIMGWINSDDLYTPGALLRVGKFFAENPDVDVVYGNRIIVDASGNEVGRWILPGHDAEFLQWNDFIPQETLFWRREIYDAVGGIDASFQFALDWDLLLRFLRAGAKFAHLPEFLGCFRAHEEQKSQAEIDSVGMKEVTALRERELGSRFCQDELEHRVVDLQRRAVVEADRLMPAVWP